MKKITLYLCLILLLLGCDEWEPKSVQSVQLIQTEHQGMPPLSALSDSWNTIHPGGDTTCLYGTEYGFFVKPESTRQALITFPG